MALFAVAFPIPPEKMDQWRRFVADLNGARKAEYKASRERMGVHERAFLQQTPHGDLVLLTMEGENPGAAMAAIGQGTDPFTEWMVAQVQEIHGVDLRNLPGPPPEMVADSQG
jgi:hypothetical protein